jgi:4-hydroxy-tetrahydrodipicolinate synthase
MVQASLKGDFATARKLHYQLQPLFNALFIETNPVPIKAAMQMCGHASGPCRLPLCSITPENEKKLKAVIEQLPQEWWT